MSSQYAIGAPDGPTTHRFQYRWLGLEPCFVPVADKGGRGAAPALLQLVEAARLSRAANRATARGEDFPADVRQWLQPGQEDAIRQQLVPMFPQPFIATMCAEEPAVSLETAKAAREARAVAASTVHDRLGPAKAADAFDGVHYTWHAAEGRFLPLVDMDGTGPLPGPAEYTHAGRLTLAAAVAAARGEAFPASVMHWLTSERQALDARRTLLAQLGALGPRRRGARP